MGKTVRNRRGCATVSGELTGGKPLPAAAGGKAPVQRKSTSQETCPGSQDLICANGKGSGSHSACVLCKLPGAAVSKRILAPGLVEPGVFCARASVR